MQITGAAMISSQESKHQGLTTANHILLAGLTDQSAALLSSSHLTLVSHPLFFMERNARAGMGGKEKFMIGFLGGVKPVGFMRTLFGSIDIIQGVFGELTVHEGYFVGVEFVLMLLAVWTLAVVYPVRWFGKRMEEHALTAFSILFVWIMSRDKVCGCWSTGLRNVLDWVFCMK